MLTGERRGSLERLKSPSSGELLDGGKKFKDALKDGKEKEREVTLSKEGIIPSANALTVVSEDEYDMESTDSSVL